MTVIFRTMDFVKLDQSKESSRVLMDSVSLQLLEMREWKTREILHLQLISFALPFDKFPPFFAVDEDFVVRR